jgi:CheY-like chemotaxis protein
LENMLIELIKIIPSILWFFLFIFVFFLFYRPIRDQLLPNLSSFKAYGIEFTIVQDLMDAALELAEKSPQWKVEVPNEDKKRALNRAKKHLKIFRDAQILWVDDHPENNLNERRMFRQLKAEMDIAKSTEEALDILEKMNYDLVISDMDRGNEPTAGMQFLLQFRQDNNTTPVIFYIGVIAPEKGVPPYAFGITNRPDELLHLCLDALERKKY